MEIEAFVQATEDRSKVVEAIYNFVGDDIGSLECMELEGVHKNPIIRLVLSIRREKDILSIVNRWKYTEFWSKGLEHIDDRLDDSMVYHLRIDKMSAYADEPELHNIGESIEIKLKIATYPSSREGAKEILLSI